MHKICKQKIQYETVVKYAAVPAPVIGPIIFFFDIVSNIWYNNDQAFYQRRGVV